MAKLWRNKSLDRLMVRLQNDTDMLENALAVASKIKCVCIIQQLKCSLTDS